MIPGSWNGDPHLAPFSAGSLLLPLPVLPLLVLSNKKILKTNHKVLEELLLL